MDGSHGGRRVSESIESAAYLAAVAELYDAAQAVVVAQERLKQALAEVDVTGHVVKMTVEFDFNRIRES